MVTGVRKKLTGRASSQAVKNITVQTPTPNWPRPQAQDHSLPGSLGRCNVTRDGLVRADTPAVRAPSP